MPDRPGAEIVVDDAMVRHLIATQAGAVPDAASMPIAFAAEGWDCTVWRLGEDLAVRLPRRSMAVRLVEHEQRHLPIIASRLEATGVGVPAPVVMGSPTAAFPWPWSVVPWFRGDAGLTVPRAHRSPWAESLAAALIALHEPALETFPRNPFRGVPLAVRADTVADRLASRRARGTEEAEALATLARLWAEGLNAGVWSGPPTWIHGDLHPGNVIARNGRLVALIDFGDLTAGDPAYDLSTAWLTFDRRGRARFRAALAGRYDDATWTRARAWASAVTLMLLDNSDDNPPYAALGRECLIELTG